MSTEHTDHVAETLAAARTPGTPVRAWQPAERARMAAESFRALAGDAGTAPGADEPCGSFEDWQSGWSA